MQAQNPLKWLFNRDRLPEMFEDRTKGREFQQSRSQAQGHSELRTTEEGKGTLSKRGPNRTLRHVSVTLSRNSTAEFLFRGDKDYRFTGKWCLGAAHKILVTIDRTYRNGDSHHHA